MAVYNFCFTHICVAPTVCTLYVALYQTVRYHDVIFSCGPAHQSPARKKKEKKKQLYMTCTLLYIFGQLRFTHD